MRTFPDRAFNPSSFFLLTLSSIRCNSRLEDLPLFCFTRLRESNRFSLRALRIRGAAEGAWRRFDGFWLQAQRFEEPMELWVSIEEIATNFNQGRDLVAR